ncbi:hypothetical protein AN189_07810 [Loktanella sp. 3ANDIMAR09]|uniref:HpcH/HpaI aldolase/citrate lyase family protein n=1 Tax=Loktanella sp. 3ANDIMAR09 TaxID=1225657 RepID=UPI0007001812|nr:CoA ester lyase [Loktanella sp. 3ANDIMAR09]KQI68782.1 hypothetical protein AN189_07810 [Loktanella sp. 3ANDIMAR09]
MNTTYLFVPANRPERFEKALGSGADRVILDLEDAVRAKDKPAARDAIATAELDWTRVVVRINDATAPGFEADLAWLPRCRATAIMVPKAQSTGTLSAVRAAAGRQVELIPQIETALGLHRAAELLARDDTPRAAFGHLDFALDIGAAPDRDALAYARGQLVMQSRLAGAEPPIDSVTVKLDDTTALEDDTRYAKRLGFAGKLLIHPKQVEPVARIFAPSEDEVTWARRVIEAIEASGSGAVALDGKMIDNPVEDAARRILSRAAG